ncbi:phospholipase A, partial [Kingella kingae]
MKKTVFLLTSFALSAPIYADNGVAACTQITDNAARLACFDQAYTQQGVIPNPNQSKSVDLVRSYEASQANQSTQVVFADPKQSGDLTAPTDAYTPLAQLYDLEKNDPNGILSLREHEPTYILPAWYRSSPNYRPYSPTRGYTINNVQEDQLHTEAKLQISLKTKVMEDLFRTRADLWVGYTQQSN